MSMLVVHIGVEKTGTSTLQRFLGVNREALLRQGVLFPTSLGGDRPLVLPMYGQEPGLLDTAHRISGLHTPEAVRDHLERTTAAFAAELASTPHSTVVVSNELLSTKLNTPERVQRFAEWAGQFSDDIHILVYLRRQDEMFAAVYNQHLKVGLTPPAFGLPSESLVGPGTMYDFRHMLDRWGAEIGSDRLHVRVFEPGQMVDGDTVADVLSELGIDPGTPFASVERLNKRLDARSLEFLWHFNHHVPVRSDGPTPERHGLVVALQRASSGPDLRLSVHDARRVLDRFADGNADVARRYLGRADGRLFLTAPSPAVGVHDERGPVNLTVEDAVALCAVLWRAQRDRVSALTAQRDRLRGRVQQLSSERDRLRRRVSRLSTQRDRLRAEIASSRSDVRSVTRADPPDFGWWLMQRLRRAASEARRRVRQRCDSSRLDQRRSRIESSATGNRSRS